MSHGRFRVIGRLGHVRPWHLFGLLRLSLRVWPVIAAIALADPFCAGHARGAFADEQLVQYAFACEERSWKKAADEEPLERIVQQFEKLAERLEAQGVDVSVERAEFESLGIRGGTEAIAAMRLLKRGLFLRDPQLAAVERILFVKRQPYSPSHNYSALFDAQGGSGGGICALDIPRHGGRLDPSAARLVTLHDSGQGVSRDPVISFDAQTVYFAWRRTMDDYFHLYAMNADGSNLRQLTDGPFHDTFPCPLPDGGLAFMSTRCRARFLCWRPQAFVLFRMDAGGENIRPLSHANLSEWTPSLTRDGRILWMRSEYIDKGADFGHTLWAIRPDGSHPEMIFGNNTLNCYAGGRQVPGTNEILCTLVSHGGDLNGPLALVDPTLGRYNPAAVRSITADVKPHYHMSWATGHCFRDPYPIGRDVYLASHAAEDLFGLYLVDRYGNREILYLDPETGSMAPMPFEPQPAPPSLPVDTPAADDHGRFVVADVYHGLEGDVPRGTIKFIRVCQELRAELNRLPGGDFQRDHEPFEDWYATPTHKVRGPHGWPSYVAKSVVGMATVEPDGSAHFHAPAGKVLYFQALDAQLNEIQRMRSVVQLQAGETRSCIGCHDHRSQTVSTGSQIPLALTRPAQALEPPPWGAGPFSYEHVVQPVLDRQCAGCHDGRQAGSLDLSSRLDADGVPASFRTLIEGGWVHHFDYTWGREHHKADPLTFGTLKSRLWELLNTGHYDVQLNRDEMHRIKCWIDLNCPLWPDYRFRPERLTSTTASRQLQAVPE